MKISVGESPHLAGTQVRVQVPRECVCYMGEPQTAQAQGYDRVKIFLVCSLPSGWKKDCAQGSARVVKSAQRLYCHQNQLCQFRSALASTRLTYSRPGWLSPTLPSSVMTLPTLSLLALLTRFYTCMKSSTLHLATDVGQLAWLRKGQYTWQLRTSLWASSGPEGLPRKPPRQSWTEGQKNISFSESICLIAWASFLQNGRRYLLLLTPGPQRSQGFLPALAPDGQLIRSYPMRLGQALKQATTLTHICVNLSAISFLLVKKSWEYLITSSVAQYFQNEICLQDYLVGLPFQSKLSLTFRGAGKVLLRTSQSGSPYPQNLRLYRSWWASSSTQMPCWPALLTICLSASRQVQLYCFSLGQKPYHATYSRMALKPQLLSLAKSASASEVSGLKA